MASLTRPGALLVGLAAATTVRIGSGSVGGGFVGGGFVGGSAASTGVRDPRAGLAFAAVLGLLVILAEPSILARFRPPNWRKSTARRSDHGRGALVGLVGGAVLCLVPLVVHLRTPGGALDPGGFPAWALVVTAVAVAEEVFLRGTLWDALAAADLPDGAVVAVTTIAFGLLHVPFYGWAALPLDLAAGLLLGGLRQLTGGWAAPAIAHTAADLAGWWLR